MRKQLEKTGIKIFEAIPPYIPDTELNPDGRAKRPNGGLNSNAPSSAVFAAAVLEGMREDDFEIGYGMTDRHKNTTTSSSGQSFIANGR